MQFGKVTSEDHYYKGKVVNSYRFIEQSIAVENNQQLFAEYLKAADYILKGESTEVDFKIIADPATHKLKRVVVKHQITIDE